MANELSPDDMRNVWQSQKPEGVQISLEEIRRTAGRFYKTISRRNRREYIAVVFVVLGYGFYTFHYRDFLMRLGSILTIAGALYVAYQLHRKGSARTLPQDCGFECCVDFHRRELERQRDALRAIWSWYLGPLVPGLAVFTIGQELAKPPRHPQHHWIGFAVYVTILILVFVGIWWLNRMAVRFLQKQIDELNAAANR
jgi:purine-cytosine permease-like protein